MGKLLRAKDWAQTPLGPIESWPQSLRTTVSLCLASNFPISLIWGPKHVQIYNDGYWPICGGKHPGSMGQDFSKCWESAWPVIGEAFERALGGTTSYLENQRMFLDRNGYLEETFFTFSFSPIRDETGGIGGLFHPVTETTAKMLGERRTRELRDLAARTGKARTSEAAFTLAAQTLGEFDLDLPFAMFYVLDSGGKEARLLAQTGALPAALAIPRVDLEARTASAWALAKIARTNQPQQTDDLIAWCGSFSCGPYPEPPKTALALPITLPGSERPIAILVAGVSSRLPLDEAYRGFCDLIAAAVTSAVANARAYEEERQRAEALTEIDRAKTAFFSNVSHELRTPLTLMLGPLEDELAELVDPLPAIRRTRLEMAHRNSLRLLKLVNTLLDFSRIEAGRSEASYQPTDLAAYTAELSSTFRSAIEKSGLALTVDCPALPEPVYVDRDMWEKVVLNLLSNAFKHTFVGGIHVTMRWCGHCVELAVADSGVGIPAAELPRLFERFHRVKGAQSRTHEGTGIGLALVQELTGIHGGSVRVESQEGKGATFTVTVKTGCAHLPADRIETSGAPASIAARAAAYANEAQHWVCDRPAAPAPMAPPSGVVGRPNGHRPNHPNTARSRIVWADDNADMREYVRRLLAERYDVTAVPDGSAAVAAALATKPDLVLTDIMMPGLDGFGVLHALRADERTQTIPVILLSARAGEESAIGGLEAGADDYLVKPFSARELLARVQTHLAMAKLRREWLIELDRRIHERTADLEQTTNVLEIEIVERKRAEEETRKLLTGAEESRRALLGILEDQQQAEREIRELNATLERRVAQRTSELEAANKELEAFSYSVSHDLRAPLRAVDGFSQAVLEDCGPLLPEQGRRDLQTIREGTQRMGKLIDDLLRFAQLSRLPLKKREVDMAALVRDVLEESNLQRAGRQIEVRTGELPPGQGDPALLKQVWINLISNALKYTRKREQAVVEIGCVSGESGIAYFVRDNGTGFDMQYAAKLFGVFQRLHRAEDYEGTGVGLAIVQRVVHRHGGRVWADSVPDRGATFHFTLDGGIKS